MRHKYNQYFGHIPWFIYVLIASVAFSSLFISIKVASATITPFLFAFLINLANVIFHGVILLVDKCRGRFSLHRMQKQTFWVAILIGFLISSNDTTATYMFKTGAPVSIAMPAFSAGVVFLTAIFGVALLNERLSPKKVTGLLAILGGIVLLNV